MTLAGAPEDGLARGFKQSVVGLISSDWDVRPLRECVRCPPDYGINAPAVTYRDDLPTYIRITDITDDGRFASSPRVSVDDRRYSDYFLSPGDLVFARTGASVGKSYLYDPADGPFVFAGFLIRVKTDPAVLDPTFLAQYVRTARFAAWVQTMSMRSGQPGINSQEYASLPVPLPPMNEQHAIASALANVDRLVAVLDRLIAKKENVSLGLRQQLLMGHIRLAGFDGEWHEKRVADVADVDPENLPSSTHPDYSFNYVSLDDVDHGRLMGHSEQVFGSAPSRARRKIRRGDVLLGTVRPNLRSHLLFKLSDGEWICSTGFAVIRCKRDEADPRFVFAHLFADGVSRQIDALLAGSNYPAISSGDVKSLRIPMPSYDEQRAIADLITTADAEIRSLEDQRTKLQQVQKGMAHELLTGRTRLTVGAVAG